MKKYEELWLEGGGYREVYTDDFIDALEVENARLNNEVVKLREELAASERTREGLVKFYAGAVADAKRYRYLVEHLGDIEGALCEHHFVIDEEAVRYKCCQRCGLIAAVNKEAGK